MNHILAMILGFVLSFGHTQTATVHRSDAFIAPEDRTADLNEDIPVANHQQLLRRIATNSYSEDACPNCGRIGTSTSSTSQPHLLLRAPR